MHRARRTISQAPRMLRMRVREHDRLRMQPLKLSQTIKAAIDHHIGIAIRDHQRGMHAMPSRALLDLTARAKERQFHCGIGPASLMLAAKHYPNGTPMFSARPA